MRPASLLAIAFLPLAGALLLSSCGSESFCVEARTCEDEGSGGSSSGGGGSDLGGGGSGAGTGGSVDPCDACSGETPLCNADGECVACLEATDCTDPNASACGDDGACSACETHADCAHLTGTNVCDEGTCVECLSEDDCVVGEDKFVCAPDTKTCTDTEFRSRSVCQECAHDDDCREGQYCVEMSYPDPTPGVVGSFCLWARDAGGAGPNGACDANSKPYSASRTVTSVDGVTSVGDTPLTVCGLRSTTCPALNHFAQEVPGCTDATPTSNAACGAEGFNDGRCRQEGSTWKCTVPCDTSADCLSGKTCEGGVGAGTCSFL